MGNQVPSLEGVGGLANTVICCDTRTDSPSTKGLSNFQLSNERKPVRQPMCLIYGSYGFLGSRITQWATENNVAVVIAGRSEGKIKTQVMPHFPSRTSCVRQHQRWGCVGPHCHRHCTVGMFFRGLPHSLGGHFCRSCIKRTGHLALSRCWMEVTTRR